MTEPDLRARAADLSDPRDQAAYADLLRCNRCGFCTSHCPTYLATGEEGLSPRGRNQAFRALLEGRLDDPASVERFFSSCLLCGICTSVCFAEVPTAGLMSRARGRVKPPSLLVKAVLGLLRRPRWMGMVLRILFLGKRLGISRALDRVGLLRAISPFLAEADAALEQAPDRVYRGSPAPPDARAVQFLACGPRYLRPSVGESTEKLLRAAGVPCGRLDNVCCGLPGISAGDLDAARRMAQDNIALFERRPEAVVLVDDSSCAAALKDCPSWFDPQDPWRARAEAFAARVKDLVEWLAENPPSENPAPGAVLTYHDPCKARYGQKIVDPPRKLLRGLPDAAYVELPEADQCCGGGGVYAFVHPDISRAVLDRKARCVDSTGASVALTSSVSCLLQVERGLRRAKSAVRAMHLSEFFSLNRH